MYTRFSSYVVKAQFALAIMRQMQEKRNVQVARLLGRKTLEILEIEDGTYREFYWYLADILPEVCDKTNFEGNVDLFIDVHRALDEVSTISDHCRQIFSTAVSCFFSITPHRPFIFYYCM